MATPPAAPPPGKKLPRQPLSIDDVAIDFSGVVGSKRHDRGRAALAVAPVQSLLEKLQRDQEDGRTQHNRDGVSDVRAFDPGLQGVTQRYAAAAGLAPATAVGTGGFTGGPLRRKKKTFGGAPQDPSASAALGPSSAPGATVPTPSTQVVTFDALRCDVDSTTASMSTLEASQAALDFLMSAQLPSQDSVVTLRQRHDAYRQNLQKFCQQGRRRASTDEQKATLTRQIDKELGSDVAGSVPLAVPRPFPQIGNVQTNSLIRLLFDDGVPDIEPWDRWTSVMPRYGDGPAGSHLIVSPATATREHIRAAKLDLIHHAVIPDTHYTRNYEYRDLEQPVLLKEYKTKEELRLERRERLKAKQAKASKERAAASSAATNLQEMVGASHKGGALTLTSTDAARLLHDRLSTKSLVQNLFGSSVLNPLAADTQVLQQYELRHLEHQRLNHDRHVAALPNQILKRAREQRRHAIEAPLLRAYRVYPIYSAAHLGKLRNFANDNLLRGFVLYVAGCDALIVLTGGEVAARHLDRWIMRKMEWEHPDTRAKRLCTVPLMDAECFSFHLKKADTQGRFEKKAKVGERNHSREDVTAETDNTAEPVYINMVPTVEEAEAFLRKLPAPPSSPWSDLCGIWRMAYLPDGLS